MKNLPRCTLLFGALLLLACNDTSKTLLFERSGATYSYEVYQENGSQENFSFNRNSLGFQMEGAKAKLLVKQVMTESTPHKRVRFENFPDTLRHSVDFTGKWDKAAKKHFLEDLLKQYNLQLTKTTQKEEFQEIVVRDAEKLNSYLSEDQRSHFGINYKKNGNVFLKNARLEDVPKFVQGNFTYEGTNKKRYNFEWSRKNLETNKGFLKKYGLTLRGLRKPVLYYNLKHNPE